MNLKQYIAESERVYNYRLKSVIPLDDDAMDRLETAILKYQPIDITRPIKTMLQKNPLDFPNVFAAEVFICDITLGLPASSYVLQNEIRTALHTTETNIVVRGYNDPTEIETNRLNTMAELDSDAREQGLEPRSILTDPNYGEFQEPEKELYGNSYNSKFLNYLRKIEKEDEDKHKVDAHNSLFSWMDLPKSDVIDDDGAHNKDIKDAPTVGDAKGETIDTGASNHGNMSDHKKTYKRLYGKNGLRMKDTIVSKDVDTLKAPK